MLKVELVADSLAPNGKRLSTFLITCPKYLLQEINTHRALSRNAASSRAIPSARFRKYATYFPGVWQKNCKGMQGKEIIQKPFVQNLLWNLARNSALIFHWLLSKTGVHKQQVNRLLEPFVYVDLVLSGTEWNNFLTLRNNEAAEPNIQNIARMIQRLLEDSTPKYLNAGQWHLPFITDDEYRFGELETLKQVSVARCARTTMNSHTTGKISTVTEDVKLYGRLLSDRHLSPFEHVAMALSTNARCGNFVGFLQLRKQITNESGGDYVESTYPQYKSLD